MRSPTLPVRLRPGRTHAVAMAWRRLRTWVVGYAAVLAPCVAAAQPSPFPVPATRRDVDGISTGVAGDTAIWLGRVRTRLDLSVHDTAAAVTGSVVWNVARDLERKVRDLPSGFSVEGRPCHEANARYEPAPPRITLCFELLDEMVAREAPYASRGEASHVFPAALFVAFHEVGHALINVWDLPVVGREEDAADGFAAWWLLRNHAPAAVVWAAWQFRVSSPAGRPASFRQYGAEHGLPEQRYASLLCWAVGAGADVPELLRGDLPAQRLAQCREEYAALARSWERLAGPRLKPSP